MTDWRRRYAQAWAEAVHTALSTTYPYAAQHVSSGPEDVDVTPDRLHPAFHGCFDWHSSVHMQWSALRLLEIAGDHLRAGTRDDLVDLLDRRLTTGHGDVEAAYLRANPRFERPYGWAWSARLAVAASHSSLPQATTWARALAPLLDVVGSLVSEWLPRLAYPVRSGEHANLAFGLSLLHDAFTNAGRPDLVRVLRERSLEWFAGDTAYPVEWEPSGSDFLSPALCEADLMRRVMDPERFSRWLAAFHPGLGAAHDPLLSTPAVLDPTDGKAVHLYGLTLSRAWQLRSLAPFLDDDRRGRIREVTARQLEHIEREIVEGDFMSTHWLVSFAVLAATVDD